MRYVKICLQQSHVQSHTEKPAEPAKTTGMTPAKAVVCESQVTPPATSGSEPSIAPVKVEMKKEKDDVPARPPTTTVAPPAVPASTLDIVTTAPTPVKVSVSPTPSSPQSNLDKIIAEVAKGNFDRSDDTDFPYKGKRSTRSRSREDQHSPSRAGGSAIPMSTSVAITMVSTAPVVTSPIMTVVSQSGGMSSQDLHGAPRVAFPGQGQRQEVKATTSSQILHIVPSTVSMSNTSQPQASPGIPPQAVPQPISMATLIPSTATSHMTITPNIAATAPQVCTVPHSTLTAGHIVTTSAAADLKLSMSPGGLRLATSHSAPASVIQQTHHTSKYCNHNLPNVVYRVFNSQEQLQIYVTL